MSQVTNQFSYQEGAGRGRNSSLTAPPIRCGSSRAASSLRGDSHEPVDAPLVRSDSESPDTGNSSPTVPPIRGGASGDTSSFRGDSDETVDAPLVRSDSQSPDTSKFTLCKDITLKLSRLGPSMPYAMHVWRDIVPSLIFGSALSNIPEGPNITMTQTIMDLQERAASGYETRVEDSEKVIEAMGLTFAFKSFVESINVVTADSESSDFKKIFDVIFSTAANTALYLPLKALSEQIIGAVYEHTLPADEISDGFSGYDIAKDEFTLIAAPLVMIFLINKGFNTEINGQNTQEWIGSAVTAVTTKALEYMRLYDTYSSGGGTSDEQLGLQPYAP